LAFNLYPFKTNPNAIKSFFLIQSKSVCSSIANLFCQLFYLFSSANQYFYFRWLLLMLLGLGGYWHFISLECLLVESLEPKSTRESHLYLIFSFPTALASYFVHLILVKTGRDITCHADNGFATLSGNCMASDADNKFDSIAVTKAKSAVRLCIGYPSLIWIPIPIPIPDPNPLQKQLSSSFVGTASSRAADCAWPAFDKGAMDVAL